MKKSVMLSVLGLGLAAVSTNARGQGGIYIGNYQAPYNPVLWYPGSPDADGRVSSTDGVTLTLFWGPGTLSDPNLLTQSTALAWNTSAEASGYFGYYGTTTAFIQGWTSGSTWTFQVRASGNSIYGSIDFSSSALWQESANINDVSSFPPGPPGISQNSIGFVIGVPEPSTFALAGLGAGGLILFRRRK